VSATIAVSASESAAAKWRPATGAIDGPEFNDRIGLRATSATGCTPPLEVLIKTEPAKPSSRTRCSSWVRWALISGFSDASIHVEEARRYSRSVGLRACESVYGTPGRRSSSRSATRNSCAGLTIAHSRQTPTASTRSSRNRSITPTIAVSSSGRTSVPA
jgi:hypothetical protein